MKFHVKLVKKEMIKNLNVLLYRMCRYLDILIFNSIYPFPDGFESATISIPGHPVCVKKNLLRSRFPDHRYSPKASSHRRHRFRCLQTFELICLYSYKYKGNNASTAEASTGLSCGLPQTRPVLAGFVLF